ncbi:Pectinesterase [Clostridium cellulovorans 743B]|uniref:Pectinesterase n=1 Tax=Clostridium cellulovorans (strain ATCC 35296 / DSM 3052 / OCM 3 / 743B) TaxID=573061 RepID=D9SRB6_CLOC7|nr:Pectinesterase [Clostridium cellulovorans 743B]
MKVYILIGGVKMQKKSKRIISNILILVLLFTTSFNNITIFAADMANDRKIDVWDFGGVQTSGDLYNNVISTSTLDNLTTITAGKFAGGKTTFGDLSIIPNITDRSYYNNSEGTPGKNSYGTWGNAAKIYNDGYTSAGGYYCNGTTGGFSGANRFLTIDNVVAGDKLSVYGGTSNGNEKIHLLYLGTDGTQDTAVDFTITASRADLVAKYSGSYRIYVSSAAGGKPYFHRVVRTPGVKISGKVNLNANSTSADFTFVNQTTGDATDIKVKADNTFDTVLAADYKYTAVLKGDISYKISKESKVVEILTSDILTGKSNVNLDVVANHVATIAGSFKGFDNSYNVSKLQMKLVPDKESLSSEVTATVDTTAKTFTAIVEQGVQYTAVISGINDYEIIDGASVNISTNTTKDITVAKKAVYTATGNFLNLSETAKIQSISFTNVEDGYNYTGNVVGGGYSVSLRNGAYTVNPECTEKYQTSTHVVVNGQNTTKDIKFNQVIDGVQELPRVPDLYVGDSSKDNNFSTVKEALDAAAKMNPTSEAERITIHIAPGTYRAQLKISTPYITLVNSNPSQEVKLTWYYGFGYEYYSVGADGFYNEDRSFDKYSKRHVSDGKWGGSVYLTSAAKEFKAENIVFENSFNKYITKEELADGVVLCKTFPQSTSINVERTANLDVTSKAATERAAAMIIDADNVEFNNCSFIGSQDTLYTGISGANNQYFKDCFIEGNTDYIFGDGNVVFDNCKLNFCGYSDQASAGYITAAKDTATYGYLFRNSTVTAKSKNKQTAGFFGRPWGPKARVKFANTKLESSSIIDPKGWTDMSGATPENADFAEFNTTYNDVKVDTTARRSPVLSDETSIASIENYFGGWIPKYYTGKIGPVKEVFEWKSIEFGASTSSDNNTVVVDDTNKTVTVTAGLKDGTKTGGKITGSQDGISYYYTEIDPSKNFEISADVKVNYFAKPNPDGQEGFGLMARDSIGKNGDASVFASNMVMVGGYGGSKNVALIQSVFRNNVKDSSGMGAVMEDITKFGDRPANDGTATYKLTMKKTNTGYHVSVNNGKEKIYYRPKQLEVLDKDKIYVGLFAARVASITVSNIDMKTSNVETDPVGVPEPPRPTLPAVSATSLDATSSTSYALKATPNVKGNLQVKLAGTEIYNKEVEGNKEFVLNTTLVNGENTFDITFTPASTEFVSSFDPINIKKLVTVKNYGVPGGAIYVSPSGTANAAGTEKDPIDIYSATKFISEGQTIYVRGGTYNLTVPLIIARGNNGIADKLKVLSAYPNERPVFDFGTKSQGFNLDGDYWNVYGIDVTKAASAGFRISGNNNVAELVNTYENGDTGFQISGSAAESKDKWPANNLALNCTSYDNRDASENNADGFAAKITVGAGNVFRGCIAHNNTDDGWDLYSKSESGPIEPVVVENCVAYGNGALTNGTMTKGDGNGFKLGGEGLAVKHILRNSLAFKNKSNGVTNNSDPAVIIENVTSVDNGKSNFEFHYYSNPKPTITTSAKNSISFRTSSGISDDMPNLASEDNYFYFSNDDASKNISGKQLLASDFKSVTAPTEVTRAADGSIILGDYMVLASKTVSIASIISPAAVKVTKGNTVILPQTVTAVYSDETQKEVAVEWGNVDTSTVGTKIVEGIVEGYARMVTITVNVEAAVEEASNLKPGKLEDKIIDNNIRPEALKEIVINAKPEDKIIINAQEKQVASAEVFKALQGIDKEVSFRLQSQGKTIIWTFNGKDIKDVNTSVDLSLNLEILNKDAINSIASDAEIISFKNHGVLPASMKVSISVDTNKFDIIKPIYVYYYNETTKKAELVGDGLKAYKIGEVYFVDVILTHNSDYFMTGTKVVEAEIKQDTEAKSEKVETLVQTGSFLDLNVLVLSGIIIMGIGFVMLRKKKEN